jgi:hypothetical protein
MVRSLSIALRPLFCAAALALIVAPGARAAVVSFGPDLSALPANGDVRASCASGTPTTRSLTLKRAGS